MKIPLYCACTPLFVCLLLPGGAAGQSRMFGTQPDFLLGLRSDRSASITLADVDGDQDLDVIVANGRHWPQANEVFINTTVRRRTPVHIAAGGGYGRFTLAYTLGSELTTSYAVPAGDLDGDGDLDVVVGNDRAQNLIYSNDGTGRFSLTGYLAQERARPELYRAQVWR